VAAATTAAAGGFPVACFTERIPSFGTPTMPPPGIPCFAVFFDPISLSFKPTLVGVVTILLFTPSLGTLDVNIDVVGGGGTVDTGVVVGAEEFGIAPSASFNDFLALTPPR
jgi:hypothetical protein